MQIHVSFCVIVYCLIGVSAYAQDGNKTSGACSPIVSDNRGTITVECAGVPKDVGEQIIQILNKILSRQIDQQIVLNSLSVIAHPGRQQVW
jgi:hypothetical protein